MSPSTIRLLSAGSVEPGLVRAVAAFSASAGCKVDIEWATTPNIRRRLAAGERFDLVLLTADAAADLTAADKLLPEPHAGIGSVGVGVAVRAGASAPTIATSADVKRALGAAEAVIFTLATSGLYVESMLRREGVYDALLPRILRFETGPQMMDHLIRSVGNVVCVGAAVELRMFDGKGVHYVGPLPDPLQHRTPYVVARTVEGSLGEEAAALARYLAGPEGRGFFAECGVDVPGR